MLKTARPSFEPTIIHASGLRLDLELKNMIDGNTRYKVAFGKRDHEIDILEEKMHKVQDEI